MIWTQAEVLLKSTVPALLADPSLLTADSETLLLRERVRQADRDNLFEQLYDHHDALSKSERDRRGWWMAVSRVLIIAACACSVSSDEAVSARLAEEFKKWPPL
jgi:hypothetical protein